MARDRNPNARRRVTTTGVHIRKPDQQSWGSRGSVELVDDALVVVAQAYCHNGHSLIHADNQHFGGFPGVKVRVKAARATQDVVLSPIHGHRERSGGAGIPDGTQCEVKCSTCNEQLQDYAPCPCGNGTLRAIYLTPDCDKAHVAAICDIWGCQRSRVVDEWEILSEAVDTEADPVDDSIVV